LSCQLLLRAQLLLLISFNHTLFFQLFQLLLAPLRRSFVPFLFPMINVAFQDFG
jgi:hypothetical protein